MTRDDDEQAEQDRINSRILRFRRRKERQIEFF